MIPTIIFFLLRRYKRHHPAKAERIQLIVTRAGKAFGLVILCMVISLFSSSQEKRSVYIIYRNGSAIGSINFSQSTSGNRTSLKLESEMKTRFIFTITSSSIEETIYDKGIMIWSSIYRKMNGNEKANKKIKASGNNYIVYSGSKSEPLDKYPIRYNMLSLYAVEPTTISHVYSDTFEEFIAIHKIADHKYKIILPDGNYNYYHYENGILCKVEINSTFYSANIQLKK
jgi:hypothetical protein